MNKSLNMLTTSNPKGKPAPVDNVRINGPAASVATILFALDMLGIAWLDSRGSDRCIDRRMVHWHRLAGYILPVFHESSPPMGKGSGAAPGALPRPARAGLVLDHAHHRQHRPTGSTTV